MKIFLHTLALTVVLLSALLPAASVFAYSEQSPAEPAAVFIPQADEPLLEPYWYCEYGAGGSSANCPEERSSTPTMLVQYSGGFQGALGRYSIICTTADCPPLAYYVYVRLNYTLVFPSDAGVGTRDINLQITSTTTSSSVNYSYSSTITCNVAPGQVCNYSLYLPIKKAQVSSWNSNSVLF